MYRLREMDVDDKVCEQVSMTMLSQVYPKEVIERCVRESEPWSSKVRRLLGAAAINTGQGPIPKCAVCSWPSVAAMEWLDWRSAAMMSRKCMERTAYWSRWGRICWCWSTQASPREAFSSTLVNDGLMCWEP